MLRPLALTLLALAVAARAAPPPGPLSAEELFRSAPLGEAKLSPDGRHLGAIVTDKDDVKNLLIYDMKDYRPSGLRGSGSLDIFSFHWLGSDRVVFSVSKEKVYSFGLYAASIASLFRYTPINEYDGTEVIGVPRARPNRVLVWIRQSAQDDGRPGPLLELDASHRASAFDTANRSAAVVRSYSPPKDGPVIRWDSDREGDLALCMTWARGRSHLHRYQAASNSWVDVRLPLGARPMALDPDGHSLWVVTYSSEKGYVLRQFDLESGDLGEGVLTDRSYDISAGHLYFSERGRNLAGVAYTQRQRVSVWFSNDYGVAQATMNLHRPATTNVLVDTDRAERKFIFLCTGAQHPGTIEILDLDAKTLRTLADEAPGIAGRQLLPVQPISFPTRDGVRLEGYLTLPAGAGANHPVPLVVLCHGGPWVRDTPDYNPEVQFLASRGYAVLQPNYRGSTGYSPEISHEREFDFRRMSDDVTDATRAILSTGMVDPKRVAIMGGSFGGYLAVAGVAFESGLYRCAVTVCGVFDWERQIKSKSDVARPGEYEELTDKLGKPGRDNELLRQISPIDFAGQIKVPVLIAHGTEDNVVDVAQSRKLASALKRAGVPHETFFRPLEGHGFFNYGNRVDFYHLVEAFLAENLGGATLTPVR